MSQHDFDIANQGFAAFRADLNNALKALGSLSSATAEPATTYANQLWYETDTNILHIRNEANSAWLDLMVIDQTTGSPSFTAGNVGIGTASPSEELHIRAAVPTFRMEDSDNSAYTNLLFNGGSFAIDIDPTGLAGSSVFSVDIDGTEIFRANHLGNVLVGKATSDSGATAGIELGANNTIYATRSGSAPLVLRRDSTDGPIAIFSKDGTTLGTIQAFNGALTIAGITATGPQVKIMNNTTSVVTLGAYASASQYGYIGDESAGAVGVAFVNVALVPVTANDGALADNTFDIGSLAGRWDDIYATNGTIQTSDRNEKQDIEELNDAERRVAVACKGLLRKYRWKDAVAEKGDEARIHFGIIAQDLQDAFAAEGLDAGRYAMFISSTWWEHDGKIYDTAEEAPEGATERTRLGVRYPELLAFIIAVI